MCEVFEIRWYSRPGFCRAFCSSLLSAYLLAGLCSSCTLSSRELDLESEAKLSMEELISVMSSGPTGPSVQEKQRTAQVSKLKACVLLVTRISTALRELSTHLKNKPANPTGLSFQLAQLSPAHCSGPTYQKTLDLTQKVINSASKHTGLILPLSGENQALAASVAQGAKAASQTFVPGPGQQKPPAIIIKDSQGSAEGALQALAELVFYDDVSLVVGGLSLAEATAIAPFSKDLLTPLLLLNKDRQLLAEHPFALQIYPNEYDLAKTLAQASKKRGFRRLTILKPSSGKSDLLCELFKTALREEGLSVTQELSYEAGNYPSMEKAVTQITHTGTLDRKGELARLTAEARLKAKDAGEAFNPRSVILSAKISSDAIFLPDHFQMVRYFVKLLKYHGVDKIPLIGTPEWRSRDLIEPWDDFMEGAIFADFIGSYRNLPNGIKASPLNISDFLVSASSASLVDFQMIGFRASSIATQTLSTPFLKRRFVLKQLLRGEETGTFFNTKQIFYSDRTTWWPTFLFAVSEKGLSLEPE